MTSRRPNGERLCRLQQAVGRVVTCTRDRCPFWEPGGAVLEGRCAFDRVDVLHDPDLARHLLEIRHDLESATTAAEEAEARRRLRRLGVLDRSD